MIGVGALVWYFADRKEEQARQEAAAFALTVPGEIEPVAKDIMARACNMLDWIDHLALKPGEPLPADLILSDGRAPWEPLPYFEDALAKMESRLGGKDEMETMMARDKLGRLRDAGLALRAAAADLLTAEVAVDAGRAATAQSKFKSAREQAQRAVNRAEEAKEPLSAQPILEGGAVVVTAEDPCDAL